MASHPHLSSYPLRLEWGASGAHCAGADAYVVIDVLSFSTTVAIAVGRGTTVYPVEWRDDRAVEFARQKDATLAVGRLEAVALPDPRPPSRSPSLLLHSEAVPRLVLPSPNGATISAQLGSQGKQVAAGCLRNACAVSSWVERQLRQGQSVALIPAGEQWAHDGSLRPALEDHLGAGAIAHELIALGWADTASPEVHAAAALFAATAGSLRSAMIECTSGQELIRRGFVADVEVAADLNSAGVLPLLVDGGYTTQ